MLAKKKELLLAATCPALTIRSDWNESSVFKLQDIKNLFYMFLLFRSCDAVRWRAQMQKAFQPRGTMESDEVIKT